MGPDGSRNALARLSLPTPVAINVPEDMIASYVCEGCLMLKLTKGAGARVTVLKEETSKPTGSEMCEELEGLEEVEEEGSGFD